MACVSRWALCGPLAVLALTVAPPATRADLTGFHQTNLVTSATDSDLINPWGLVSSPTGSPIWVSDNGTGHSTLYDGFTGAKQARVVNIRSITGGGATSPPTGVVFNGDMANFLGDRFIFATEDGQLNGWQAALDTTAAVRAAIPGAVYKGLAINALTNDTLYAANFANGNVDVFDSAYALTGPLFTDPNLPAGYAPFNVQFLGGKLYVTFALKKPGTDDDDPGQGRGIIDVVDPVTHAFTRLATGSAAGGTATSLDSPWGLALAPASFGPFGGDLLVGNFGDGKINAFDPTTGAFLGTLSDPNGNPLVNPGLWGLMFGTGGNAGGDPDALYFTAGGTNEDTGVLGRINAVPEPGSFVLLGLGGAAVLGGCLRRTGPSGRGGGISNAG